MVIYCKRSICPFQIVPELTCAIRSPCLHCRCPPPSEPLHRWQPPRRGPTYLPSEPPPAFSSRCTPAPPVSYTRTQQEAVTVGSYSCLLTATETAYNRWCVFFCFFFNGSLLMDTGISEQRQMVIFGWWRNLQGLSNLDDFASTTARLRPFSICCWAEEFKVEASILQTGNYFYTLGCHSLFLKTHWRRSEKDFLKRLFHRHTCKDIFLKAKKKLREQDLKTTGDLCAEVFCHHPPDVLICNYEGLAQRLSRVEPHSRVLLHGRGQLAGDGRGAGVQGAGNCRQESLVCAAWADTWGTNRVLEDFLKIQQSCNSTQD